MPKSKVKFKLFTDEELVIQTKHIENREEKVREKFLFSVLGIGGLVLLTIGSFMMFFNLNFNFYIIQVYMALTLIIGGFFITSISIYAWHNLFYVKRTVFYITTTRMVQAIEKKDGLFIKKKIKLTDISHLTDLGITLEVMPKKLDGKGYYQGNEEEVYPRTHDSIVIWLRGLRGNRVMKKIKKLAHLIWLLIRVAVLVFAWIVFALLFLFVNLIIITMMGLVIVFDLFTNIEYSLSLNNITVDGDINFSIGYEVEMYYVEFFEIEIPLLLFYFSPNDFRFELSCTLFTNNIGVPDYPENMLEQVFDGDTNPGEPESGKGQLRLSSTEDEVLIWSILLDFLICVGAGIGISSTFICIISGILEVCKTHEHLKIILTVASIALLILSLIVTINIIINSDPNTRAIKFIGLGYGLFIGGLFSFIMSGYLKTHYFFMADLMRDMIGKGSYDVGRFWELILEIVDIIGASSMLTIDWGELIDWNELDDTLMFKFWVMVASLGFAISSLFLLAINLTLFGGNEDRLTDSGLGYGLNYYGFNASKKSIVAFVFGLISMAVGGILVGIGWAILLDNKNN